MTEQITLLDVCKLPDVQIHSKTALFKYLVGRETTEMLKLRQNIVKLSYTNKIIGVKDNQVGIISKRLPLKFKQAKHEAGKKQNQQFRQESTGFISHRNFYVQPLPTVRKTQSEPKIKTSKPQFVKTNLKIELNVEPLNIINLETQSNFKQANQTSAKSFRSRTQSMARLKIYNKKEVNQDFTIKRKTSKNLKYPEGSVKSFSNLLKEFKTNEKNVINPLMHEQNTLFKRFQRLSQKSAQRKSSKQSQYENLMEIIDD